MSQPVAPLPSWARADRARLAIPVAIVVLLTLVAVFSAMIGIDTEARFGASLPVTPMGQALLGRNGVSRVASPLEDGGSFNHSKERP